MKWLIAAALVAAPASAHAQPVNVGVLRCQSTWFDPPTFRTLRNDPDTRADLLAGADDASARRPLSMDEIADLVAFLRHALLEPVELVKGPHHGVPTAVPSGLPVDHWPGGPHPSR